MATVMSLGCAPNRGLASRSPRMPVSAPRRGRGAARRVAAFSEAEGPTGLNIQGSRVTSPRAWEILKETLRGAGVALVSAQEVDNAAKRGTPVLDIRPVGEFGKGRLPGSVNIEFYRLISGWGAWQTLRRAGYAFFGIAGTEPNPDFLEEVAAAAGGNKKAPLVLVCNLGGSLDKDSSNAKHGQQTRSLVAAYSLVQAGYTNVKVLKGGFFGYAKAERPVEYDE